MRDQELHRPDSGRTPALRAGADRRARTFRPLTHRVGVRDLQALATLYDDEGGGAYDVAVVALGDAEAAARAVESAFRELALTKLPTASRRRRLVLLTALSHALAAEHEHPLPACDATTGLSLDTLARDERQALAYCGRGKITVSEAAAILGEDVATIHRRLAHALRQLATRRRSREDATARDGSPTATALLAHSRTTLQKHPSAMPLN